jgi:hypothetical protein
MIGLRDLGVWGDDLDFVLESPVTATRMIAKINTDNEVATAALTLVLPIATIAVQIMICLILNFIAGRCVHLWTSTHSARRRLAYTTHPFP